MESLPLEITSDIIAYISTLTDIISLLQVNRHINKLTKLYVRKVSADTVSASFILMFPNVEVVDAYLTLRSANKNDQFLPLARLKKLRQITICWWYLNILNDSQYSGDVAKQIGLIVEWYLIFGQRKDKNILFITKYGDIFDNNYLQIIDNGFNMNLDHRKAERYNLYSYIEPLMLAIEQCECLYYAGMIDDNGIDVIERIGKNYPSLKRLSYDRFITNIPDFIKLTSVREFGLECQNVSADFLREAVNSMSYCLDIWFDEGVRIHDNIKINLPIYWKEIPKL